LKTLPKVRHNYKSQMSCLRRELLTVDMTSSAEWLSRAARKYPEEMPIKALSSIER
jgi:hypothetical protein